jgi:MFS family permease
VTTPKPAAEATAAATAPPESNPAVVRGRRNFWLLLLQGSFFTAAVQLTSAYTVLPYICADLAGPPIVVGLLVPAYTAGALGGTVLAPRVLGSTRPIAQLHAGIALFQALTTATMATAIVLLPADVSAYAVLVGSAGVGLMTGSSLVVFPMTLSTLLSPKRRGDLLLRQAGYGAVLMIVVSAYSSGFLSDEYPGLENADLLWIGAAGMVVAAGLLLAMGSRETAGAALPRGIREVLHEGRQYSRRHGWLRRYVATQLMFTSVTLGPLFYGIYASESLGPGNSDLDIILIFAGFGLLVGIPFWTFVHKYFDTRGMYVCSASISAIAAVLCICAQAFRLLPALWTFGLAMFLLLVANHAIYPASQHWILGRTPANLRVVVLSYSQFVIEVGLIVPAFVVGVIAGYGPAIWPVVLMLFITLIAIYVAAHVPHAPETSNPNAPKHPSDVAKVVSDPGRGW